MRSEDAVSSGFSAVRAHALTCGPSRLGGAHAIYPHAYSTQIWTGALSSLAITYWVQLSSLLDGAADGGAGTGEC